MLLFCQTIEGKSLYGNNSKRQLYDNKLDTLSLGERISLKTNFVDWIALIPNLGAEITLGNMNWNRWTIGIYGRLNPSTHTLQTSYHVYDLSDIRFEVRRYHHGRECSARFSWAFMALMEAIILNGAQLVTKATTLLQASL